MRSPKHRLPPIVPALQTLMLATLAQSEESAGTYRANSRITGDHLMRAARADLDIIRIVQYSAIKSRILLMSISRSVWMTRIFIASRSSVLPE